MLYLNPPYYMIEGITLFPDHENKATPGPGDALRFYYLPLRPRLAWAPGPDGARVPDFQFLKYVDDSPDAPKGGAFLNFSVDLGVDDAVMARVRRDLAGRLKVDEKAISLSPVPLADGSASLMLFGARSGDAGGGKFVTRIDQAAKPALFGDNPAVFSVSLEKDGAVLAEESLAGKRSPLGVIYSLQFNALKPAYRVKVTADWEQVAKAFAEQTKARLFFFSADIRKTTQELVDKRVIRIEADTYVTADESKEAVEQKAAFLAQLTDMITTRFFEPKVNPAAPRDDAGKGIAGILGSVMDVFAANGGVSFGYSQSKAEASMKVNLSAEATERITVRMTAAPQAYLDGLLDTVTAAGLDPKCFVKAVVLKDDFFRRRRVNVISRADFEGNGIASIVVRLSYGGEEQTVMLAKSDARSTVSWPAVLENRRMRREVKVSYTVSFVHDELAGQRPAVLTSKEVAFTGDDFEVFPYRDLFMVRTVPVEAAAAFPWDRYPRVEVGVRYRDDASAVAVERTVRLTRESPRAAVRLFVMDFRKTGYEVRLRYSGDPAAGKADVERPWTAASSDAVEVRDPFPVRRAVTFYADGVDWEQVRRVLVDARYDDPASGVCERQTLELTAARPSAEFVAFGADPARRDVGYDLRVMRKGGETETIAGSLTADGEVSLGDGARLTGRRYVQLSLEPGTPRYAKIAVELRHRDAVEGVGSTRTVEFSKTQTAAPRAWSFPFSSQSDGVYEYKLRYYNASNQVAAQFPARAADYATASDPVLVVPLAPKR